LLIDNTFATPYLCRPLQPAPIWWSISATKYLGGHADTWVAWWSLEMMKPTRVALVGIMKLAGGVLGVWEAHEIMRGVKRWACGWSASAQMPLGWRNILRIIHKCCGFTTGTGGPAERGSSVACCVRLMWGAGAIELRENTQGAYPLWTHRLCVQATSLGDVFTGVLHRHASHRSLPRRVIGSLVSQMVWCEFPLALKRLPISSLISAGTGTTN
jgi:hypothetical protein